MNFELHCLERYLHLESLGRLGTSDERPGQTNPRQKGTQESALPHSTTEETRCRDAVGEHACLAFRKAQLES